MRCGSLCTGTAGLEMAAAAVLGELDLRWVADTDPGSAKLLEHRYPGVPNLGDISKVDWGDAPESRDVDLLVAGFPCQDVSLAGSRRGLREGTRTGIWSEVARAIDQLRPGWVYLENVHGLLSAAADGYLEPCPGCLGDDPAKPVLRALGAVLGDLAALGYDAEWASLRASGAGAPHRRERVFILGWPAADPDGEPEPEPSRALEARR